MKRSGKTVVPSGPGRVDDASRAPGRRGCAGASRSSARDLGLADRARARGAPGGAGADAQAGARGLSWESLARCSGPGHFAWHSEEIDEFGSDERFTETLRADLRVPVHGVVARRGHRCRARAAEGPGLIVANHSGVLPYDGLMVSSRCATSTRPAGCAGCWRSTCSRCCPCWRRSSRSPARCGPTPRTPSGCCGRASWSGVFPEGVKGVGKRFQDRYKLARFGRGGFVRIALRTGAPIIPCAVVGAEEIHPVLAKADWIGRPVRAAVLPAHAHLPAAGTAGRRAAADEVVHRLRRPIDLEEHGAEAGDDPILVNRLSEQVRATIQRMIDGRLARRRSIWFG